MRPFSLSDSSGAPARRRAKVDGLAAKDLAAALLHTREAIRLAQSQKQARIGARWRAGVRPREVGEGGIGGNGLY